MFLNKIMKILTRKTKNTWIFSRKMMRLTEVTNCLIVNGNSFNP